MRRPFAAFAALALAVVLAGCSPTVSMSPAAEFSNDPGCADVVARLYHPAPLTIGDYPLRSTDAQGTAAWGDPTVALLYCGVPAPEISDAACIEYNGIFWLRELVDAGYAFTTYGRDPAIRVVVDDEIVGGPGVALDELTVAVSHLPENGRVCLDTDDTVTGQELG